MKLFRRALLSVSLTLALLGGGFVLGPISFPSQAAVDVSTEASLSSYLRSIGVEPDDAVYQWSLFNYAGSNCPGAGWDCVDATRPVVQTTGEGGVNLFECPFEQVSCTAIQRAQSRGATLAFGGFWTGVASAVPAPPHNFARCMEKTEIENGDPVTQSCTNTNFTQTNTTGNNQAFATQIIDQEAEGATTNQSATQTLAISQTNQSGMNSAHVLQRIRQDADGAGGAVSQTQNAFQEVEINQTSTTGNQSAHVIQSQVQELQAQGSSVEQNQNTDDGVDVLTKINQESNTSGPTGGSQNVVVKQTTDQKAEAEGAGSIAQTQGATSGGLNGEIHQESSGVSTFDAQQRESQKLEAETNGTLVQRQFGPVHCCLILSQIGNPSNSCRISQDSGLKADEGAQQTTTAVTGFNTSGNCTAAIHLSTNDGKFADTASGQTFFQVSNCTNETCGGSSVGEEPEVPSFVGGATAAGTGLRNRNSGNITISGIPAGSTITKAILVWGLLFEGSPPPGTIRFNDTPLVAEQGQISGFLCWGDTQTIAYYKDVTGFVAGNGTYVVSDPPVPTRAPDADPAGTLPYADGASLVVFFTGGGSNNQVLSDFSYDTNTDADGTINRSFSGINSVGGSASLTLAGPDGQNNGSETFVITGSGSVTLNNTWDGSDPQIGSSFSIGNLWDTDSYDVSSVVPTGQSTLTFNHTGGSDCIGIGAAVLQVSQTAPPPIG